MKKLLILLSTLFISCSSDKAENKTSSQDSLPNNQIPQEVKSLDIALVPIEEEILLQDEKITKKAKINKKPRNEKKSYLKVLKQNEYNLFILSFIFMAIATIISMGVTFYLYRWRRIVIEKNEIMVPEKFNAIMSSLINEFQNKTIIFNQGIKDVKNKQYSSEEKIDEIKEVYFQLQGTIKEKEKEINRLKEGYDVKIFKSFLKSFIKVDTAIKTIKNEIDQKPLELTDLDFISKSIAIALDECGVVAFKPQIGEDIRDVDGVGEDYKKIVTDDKKKEYKIADIIEEGYVMDGNENNQIIKTAKVSVFVPKN